MCFMFITTFSATGEKAILQKTHSMYDPRDQPISLKVHDANNQSYQERDYGYVYAIHVCNGTNLN